MAKAIYFGSDMIVGAIDNLCQGDPQPPLYYSVWHNSKSKAFQYNGGEYDKGIEYLEENLKPFEEAGYGGDLVLKLHPSPCKSFYTWNSEDISTLYICAIGFVEKQNNGGSQSRSMVGYYPNMPAKQPVNDGRMTYDQFLEKQEIENLPTKISGMVAEQIAALKLELAPPAEAITEPEDTIHSVMIGHLKNPDLMSKILDMLGEVIPMLKSQVPQPQHMQVAGIGKVTPKPQAEVKRDAPIQTEDVPATETQMIEWQSKLDGALIRLAKYGDIAEDLTLLADFAEQNTEMFNGLLATVRNGKK